MSTTTNYSQQPTAEQVRLGEQHKLDNALAPYPGTQQDQKRDNQLGNQQPGQQFGTDQARVGEQQRFDNSQISGPGAQQQDPLDNSRSGPNVTGTQTDTQQPGYAQKLYEGVSNLVGSAAGAVGYAPTSNNQQQAQHPATRRVKDLEHRGGVGSLPGTPNEEDVVRLPEERAHPDPLNEPVGGLLDDAAQRAAYTSAAPIGSSVHAQTGGSTVGNNLDNHHGLGMDHQKGAALASSSAGATTNTHDTSATHRQTGTDHRDSSAIMPHRDDRGPGAPTTTHDTAASHPVQAIKERTGRDTDDTHRDTSYHPNIDTSHHDDHTATSASPSSPSKPKFMDKVKGEAKIVMGKVQKNTEKVEEGRALKTGESNNNDATI
jgi:hypothetical protein